MHSIEQLMLINSLWFFNYGFVHLTIKSTFYQNKLLSMYILNQNSMQIQKKMVIFGLGLHPKVNKKLLSGELTLNFFMPS